MSPMDFYEAQFSGGGCFGSYPSGPQHHDPTSGHHEVISHDRYIAVSVVDVVGTDREPAPRRPEQRIPWLGRVSLVDYRGNTILDTYVHLTSPVEDYRAQETGFDSSQLFNAPLFQVVQQQVATLIQNKILVGHRIWKFLSGMALSHQALDTRDLALFRPFRKKIKSCSVVELETLVHLFMGRDLGQGYEDSLEISRAAMDLFRSCEGVFEEVVASGGWPCDLPPFAFAENYS